MRRGLLSTLALTALSLCWGYSWVLNKIALLDAGPFTFAAYRMLLAATALLATLPLSGRRLRPQGVGALLLLGLIQTTGFVGLSMWALVEGGVSSTSILVYSMPFWTLLLAWPVLGERVRGSQWIAVVLAAVGLLVILHPRIPNGSLLSKLLGVSAGILWAIGSVLIKRMQLKTPRDLISLTGWQMAFGALPLLGIALLSGEPAVVWSTRFTWLLLGTSIISTALCWWLWMYILKYVDAGIAGMCMLIAPVVAIASAAWHFGERPSAEEILGMTLILLALLIIGIRALRLSASTAQGPRFI